MEGGVTCSCLTEYAGDEKQSKDTIGKQETNSDSNGKKQESSELNNPVDNPTEEKTTEDVNIEKKGGSYGDVFKEGEGVTYEVHHISNKQEKTDNIREETTEQDNPELKRMQPTIKVTFTCKEKYDKEEYERQVNNQEAGMNNLTLYDYLKNRKRYSEEGRDTEVGVEAQEKARQEARADRIAENRKNGMGREEAEAEADEWLKTQAALHDPDQIAGGNSENVTGMGDKDINSSIGSQWKNKIDQVDDAVNQYINENNLSDSDMKNIYLNVSLEVKYEG